MLKLGQSTRQLIGGLLALSAIVLVTWSSFADAGGNKGNKGGDDIILYKNNLLIRGNDGKGKGKGKGRGNLLIASDGGHHHHHEHEHDLHGLGEYHHGHKEQNFILEAIREGGNGKGKGNKGKGGQNTGAMNTKTKSNDMNWELLLMGGKPGGGGSGGYGYGFK